MLNRLPIMPVPEWLAELSEHDILNAPFPLSRVLENSLYYPSSGFDGDPVKYLAGNVHSFIYVDYGYSHSDFVDALHHPGFEGYTIVGTRSITEQELTPRGWRSRSPGGLDGDPSRVGVPKEKPFCSWSVFQRREDVPASHGPSRFSLLYLYADGVAAFQALYLGNGASPTAIAIIQPGHGFGGNWTNFEDSEQILARSVLENPHGPPQILLYGGLGRRERYRTPCWRRYRDLICFLDKAGGGSIGVWVENAQEGATPDGRSAAPHGDR
jgi:hypothetical protein